MCTQRKTERERENISIIHFQLTLFCETLGIFNEQFIQSPSIKMPIMQRYYMLKTQITRNVLRTFTYFLYAIFARQQSDSLPRMIICIYTTSRRQRKQSMFRERLSLYIFTREFCKLSVRAYLHKISRLAIHHGPRARLRGYRYADTNLSLNPRRRYHLKCRQRS